MKTTNKPIPRFANEPQERAYWESHNSTDLSLFKVWLQEKLQSH